MTYDLGTYLKVVFFTLSIADVKKGGLDLKKNNFDLQKAMKAKFKVQIKVTIEFPVEKYFRNCTDLLENFVYFK